MPAFKYELSQKSTANLKMWESKYIQVMESLMESFGKIKVIADQMKYPWSVFRHKKKGRYISYKNNVNLENLKYTIKLIDLIEVA